ncbi:rhomboid-like protein [Streptomyces sp. NPDC048419]
MAGFLFVTTVALHHVSSGFEEFLRQRSTNSHGLSSDTTPLLAQ